MTDEQFRTVSWTPGATGLTGPSPVTQDRASAWVPFPLVGGSAHSAATTAIPDASFQPSVASFREPVQDAPVVSWSMFSTTQSSVDVMFEAAAAEGGHAPLRVDLPEPTHWLQAISPASGRVDDHRAAPETDEIGAPDRRIDRGLHHEGPGLDGEGPATNLSIAPLTAHASGAMEAVDLHRGASADDAEGPSFSGPLGLYGRADAQMEAPVLAQAALAIAPTPSLSPKLAGFYDGDAATDLLFGANLLFNRDVGGSLENYTTAIHSLDVSTLRYPGGTISESMFDLANPNDDFQRYYDNASLFDPDGTGPLKPTTMGLDDFIEYCSEEGVAMTFVMPTVRFASTTRDVQGNRYADVDADLVRQFTSDMLTEALANNVPITSIELGNEWWVDNSAIWGENLNAVEYGRIASSMAAIVQDAIDDFKDGHILPKGWVEPDIVVQVGPGGEAEWVTPAGEDLPSGYNGPRESSTELIFDQFDTTAEQRAVDGIVLHDYTAGTFDNINGYRYNSFDIWDDLAAGDADFELADRYVSEWNIKNGNETLTGLQQAGGLVAMMTEMMLAGVDQATAWPVQQTSDNSMTLNTGRAGETWQGLSAGGEAFRMMEESLQGLRVVPLSGTPSDVDVNAFADEDRVVFFISNQTGRSTTVSLDVSSITGDYTHVWGSLLTTLDGDYLDPDLEPVVINLTASEVTTGDLLDVELGPYSLVRIEYTLTDVGVVMIGNDQSDLLKGSLGPDQILGEQGNDKLYGEDGNDTIKGGDGSASDTVYGGNGNDKLSGQDGSDHLDGGSGADKFYGGNGNDRLYGQSGNDNLNGDTGNDSVWGGVGNDLIYGGANNDVLYGEDGVDTLYGGEGDDWLNSAAGNDRIEAGAGNDSLLGGSGKDVLYGGSGNDQLDGGSDSDKIFGDDGADRISSGSGNDVLYGGSGSDRLYGDAGSDTLFGGSGSDEFVFEAHGGSDRIVDYEAGVDTIRLQGFDGRWLLDDYMDHARQSGSDVVFQFNELTVIVEDATMTQLRNDLVFG